MILILAALFFSLMVALIKLVGQRLPVSQILFVRQVGMSIMLAPVLIRGYPESLHTNRLSLQLCRIVFALIAMMCGFTAIVHIPLADATAIAFAKSFFITIFAVLILKEQVGTYRWAAVIVGFIGVIIMVRPGTAGFSMYGMLAVIGAASAGFVMVIIRLLTRIDAPATILAYQAIGVGLIMAVPASLQWVQPTAWEWLLLFGIGLVSFFAQKANIFAYAYGEASVLASIDYVRLLYATFLGWLLFSELPGTSTWVGAAIIVLASLYTVHREAKKKRRITSDPQARSINNSQP